MLYPLILKNPAIDLDLFLLFLEQRGIETRLFFPLLQQPLYKKLFGDIEGRYPVAKQLTDRGFIIGCHPELRGSDIQYIRQVFTDFFARI
jgi:dTDP-4-amino-4,6-dideoxygalactose transaminase